jgi:hypothetical protein
MEEVAAFFCNRVYILHATAEIEELMSSSKKLISVKLLLEVFQHEIDV